MRFKLQNRYQDGGWESMHDEYDDLLTAVCKAADCSYDAICCGMVRVLDGDNVVIEYGAGSKGVPSFVSPNYQLWPLLSSRIDK